MELKDNEWLIKNKIDDGIIRIGWRVIFGGEQRYMWRAVGGNNQPFFQCDEEDGFETVQACERSATSLVAQSKYEELLALLQEIADVDFAVVVNVKGIKRALGETDADTG